MYAEERSDFGPRRRRVLPDLHNQIAAWHCAKIRGTFDSESTHSLYLEALAARRENLARRCKRATQSEARQIF